MRKTAKLITEKKQTEFNIKQINEIDKPVEGVSNHMHSDCVNKTGI